MTALEIKGNVQTLEDFRNEQIEILRDFCIELTNAQMSHMLSLKSEIAIENYKRTLLNIETESPLSYTKPSRRKYYLW